MEEMRWLGFPGRVWSKWGLYAFIIGVLFMAATAIFTFSGKAEAQTLAMILIFGGMILNLFSE